MYRTENSGEAEEAEVLKVESPGTPGILRPQQPSASPRGPVETESKAHCRSFQMRRLGVDMRMCLTNKFLGNVGAALNLVQVS